LIHQVLKTLYGGFKKTEKSITDYKGCLEKLEFLSKDKEREN